MLEYWQKQSANQPLFQDVIWSKPEQKQMSGKLLIVGGNKFGIASTSDAFAEANKQGVGECRVALPSATKHFFDNRPKDIEFVSSNNAGGLSIQSCDELLSYIDWSDATLFCGDVGSSSETFVVIEKLSAIPSIQIYCGDTLDCFEHQPGLILDRPQTLLITDAIALQKMLKKYGYPKPLLSSMALVQTIELMHELSLEIASSILLSLPDQYLVAHNGQIVTHATNTTLNHARLGACAAVWWLQHPNQPLQAIASSLAHI